MLKYGVELNVGDKIVDAFSVSNNCMFEERNNETNNTDVNVFALSQT